VALQPSTEVTVLAVVPLHCAAVMLRVKAIRAAVSPFVAALLCAVRFRDRLRPAQYQLLAATQLALQTKRRAALWQLLAGKVAFLLVRAGRSISAVERRKRITADRSISRARLALGQTRMAVASH
jgi:hypothetical protein